MKIIIEIQEDNYPETKSEIVIEDTEHEAFKWLTINGVKYSVPTSDLQLLAKIY